MQHNHTHTHSMLTITHRMTRYQRIYDKIKYCSVEMLSSFPSFLYSLQNRIPIKSLLDFFFFSPDPEESDFTLKDFQQQLRHISDTEILSISQQSIPCHPEIRNAKHSQEKSSRVFLTQANKIFLLHVLFKMSESFWLKFFGCFFSDRWIKDLTDELNFLLEKKIFLCVPFGYSVCLHKKLKYIFPCLCICISHSTKPPLDVAFVLV